MSVRRVLFVADVVGRPGRAAVEKLLPGLREELAVEFCVVNAENAAGGAGITRSIARSLLAAGADCLSSGNHIWSNRAVFEFIDDEPRLLRPINYPEGSPGRGAGVFAMSSGEPVLVVSLMGRVFMDPVDCPFRAIDRIIAEHPSVAIRIVDFHGEATSEKVAMGWYLDGRVSAVLGSHTHVPTADARVLPAGTATITDAGMTGPHDSVIGVEKAAAIRRMVTGLPTRFQPATGDVRLSAVLVEIEPVTGRAQAITPIIRRLEET